MAENQFEKKLKAVAKLKGISIRQLCIKIEMTENGLSAALKKSTIKLSTLIEISKVLDVAPYFFLTDEKIVSDSQIQTAAEMAVKQKYYNFYELNKKNTPHGLKGAILFYEKNSAFIKAEDFLEDLIIVVKSNDSLPLVLEKWRRKVTAAQNFPIS